MNTLPYPTLPYPALPYPAYPLSPSSVLMKHLPLSILAKGNCPALGSTSPWDVVSSRDHGTNCVSAHAFSRGHKGLRITTPMLCHQPSPFPAHGTAKGQTHR